MTERELLETLLREKIGDKHTGIAYMTEGDLTEAAYTWYGYRDGEVVPIP